MRPRLDQETQELLHSQALREGRTDSNMCRVAILRGLRDHLTDIAETMPESMPGENLARVLLEIPKGVHRQITFLAKSQDRSARNLMREFMIRGIKTWRQPVNAAPADAGL